MSSVKCPVKQVNAKESLSRNYKFQSTDDLIELIESHGFICDRNGIQRAGIRNEENRGFQRHLIPFDISLDGKFKDYRCILPDSKFRIIVINSHNGRGSLQLKLGVYRFVCENGLMVGDTITDARIPHRGKDFEHKVKVAINNIVNRIDTIKETILAMTQRTLTTSEMTRFAYEATGIRWDKAYSPSYQDGVVVSFESLLDTHRPQDCEDDLWTIFNVVQENLLKGGVNVSKNGKIRKSKKVNSISRQVKINQDLWKLALKVFEKEAA